MRTRTLNLYRHEYSSISFVQIQQTYFLCSFKRIHHPKELKETNNNIEQAHSKYH